MKNEFKTDSIIFKALADDKRIAILALLKTGEKCACVLIDKMGMVQSTLSYHMKILCESGLVESRQDGKWTHYQISKIGSDYAISRLIKITSEDLDEENCII